jgi:periplasmic protein CpxP/Spy
MTNNSKKSKIFLVIIAILLVSNIVLLSLFLQKPEPVIPEKRPDRKVYISEFLKKEIGFNPQQLTQYDSLSDGHQKIMKQFFDNMRNKKKLQFQQLVAGNFSDTSINRLAEESAATQKQMEVQMFNHIKSVRQVCLPDQLPKFDTSFVKIFNRRGGDPKKKTKN